MTTAPLLLTIFSAGLYALSFPPVSAFPFAWIALVPFFLAVTRVRPRLAAMYGVLWGVVMTSGVAWCLPSMLTNYFGVSFIVGWTGLLVAGIGLAGVYYGAFALWLSWVAQRRVASPFLLAAGWGACEFIRANPFIGTSWALSGYSQIVWTQLMQSADATGPYGVGMLIAAVNACFAGIYSPALRNRRPSFSIIGVALVVILTLVYGEWRLAQTFTTGEPVTVAVVQGAIERQFRFDPEHRQVNLERYLTLTKQVAASSPRLIFWPENAVDFYMQEAVPEREAIIKVARDLGVNLLLGGPSYGYGAEDRYSHNSVFLIRSGKLAGRYDKVRLLPFAETDRFGELFPGKQLHLTPGQRLQTLRTGNIRVGAFVCFEAMYPDFVRGFAQHGAEVLVNPSNDDWFNYMAPAQHQLDIATVRAIENRRYLIRPTAVGFSAIIDPYGRMVARSGFGAPEVLTASIYASRAQTPYQRWGDAVVWLALMFVVALSLSCQRVQTTKGGES